MAETRKSLLEKRQAGTISGSEYSRRLGSLIQAEQKAAAPKPKGTLLSATTGGVERKVVDGKIVPERTAVTVEAEAEPKAISAGEAGLIKAYESGRISEEEYQRARGSMGLEVTAPIVAEPAAEPAVDEVEIPVIGEEFLTPEAINLAIIGRESGIAEEGYVFDLSSPTGFREKETGQVVPITVAAPALISEDLLERAAKEEELSVIRQERDLLVDAAIQDMLTTGRLQTRGQAATVQFLRRPGSRQLAEDLLGFYGLFI